MTLYGTKVYDTLKHYIIIVYTDCHLRSFSNMTGRPKAPELIIPNLQIIYDDGLIGKNFKLFDLYETTADSFNSIKWLVEYGLLANFRNCDKCMEAK
jgi:hypothetical protein